MTELVPFKLQSPKPPSAKESSIQKAFLGLLKAQSWCRVLELKIVPRGKVSDPKVKLARAIRDQQIKEYLSFWHAPDPEVKLLVWRQNTGAAMLPGRGGRDQFVRFGQRGTPDICGITKPTGRWVGIETKQRSGYQAAEQRFFEEVFDDAGGIYRVVKDPQEGLRSLVDALGLNGLGLVVGI